VTNRLSKAGAALVLELALMVALMFELEFPALE
jgi:hypothetical protein